MADSKSDHTAIPRFGLIGCGRIGSLYDEFETSGPARSVAGAIARSSRAQLAAVCDDDETRAAACAKNRGVAASYGDYRDMLARENLEGIAICTPPAVRKDVVEAALAAGIGMIWCEKPVAASLGEALELERMVAGSDAVFAVNYLRRWAPVTERIAALVADGKLGPAQTATLSYGNGIANNGSHFIDLMTRWFGAPKSAHCLRLIADGGSGGDPTLDAMLAFERPDGWFPFYLNGSDHRGFSVCELDIMLERGRVKLLDWGNTVEIYQTAPDASNPGYTSLTLTERIEGALDDALERAVDQIVAVHLGEQEAPACAMPDGVAALRAVDGLIRSLDAKGAPITL